MYLTSNPRGAGHQGSRSRSFDVPSPPYLVWWQSLPTGFSGPSLSGCPSLEML